MKGCDTLSPVTNQLQCFKVNGIQFVARYLRNLKPEEVQAICDAGFQIVSCAEHGHPDTGSYFTKVAGVKDGEWAVRVAQSLGQSKGSAIYFTVDYGCPPNDHPHVIEYFKGVQQGVAESGYHVGGYAPGAVLTKLLSQNLIKYAWLPNARSWQQGFTNWNIKQGSETSLCGIGIDPDESRGDFGAWSLSATKPAARTLYLTDPMMRGDDVNVLQNQFARLKRLNPNHIDAVFGREMDSVVKAFQEDEGLTVDGKVGAATRAKIVELLMPPKAISV